MGVMPLLTSGNFIYIFFKMLLSDKLMNYFVIIILDPIHHKEAQRNKERGGQRRHQTVMSITPGDWKVKIYTQLKNGVTISYFTSP